MTYDNCYYDRNLQFHGHHSYFSKDFQNAVSSNWEGEMSNILSNNGAK